MARMIVWAFRAPNEDRWSFIIEGNPTFARVWESATALNYEIVRLSSGLTFDDLDEANEAREKEWETSENGFSLLFLSNALAGETGELCNVVKKIERERLGAKGSRASVADLGEEAADVVIYDALICRKAGVNLGDAVRAKFNGTSLKYGFNTRLQ